MAGIYCLLHFVRLLNKTVENQNQKNLIILAIIMVNPFRTNVMSHKVTGYTFQIHFFLKIFVRGDCV